MQLINTIETGEQADVSMTDMDAAASFIADKFMKLQKKASETLNEVAPELCPHELFSLFTADIIKENILFTR